MHHSGDEKFKGWIMGHCCWNDSYRNHIPCWVGLVVSVSASHTVDRGIASGSCQRPS